MIDDQQMKSRESQVWLEQRQRSGNWIDIANTDEIPSDIVGPNCTILHMFQIAFGPEIRRRLSATQLGDSFFLSAAQLVQPAEGGSEIRLNGEVHGIALAQANRSVQEGESIFVSDLRGLVSFDLADDELDAAHFTMLWDGEGWIVSFDFRAGRAKWSDTLTAANQFLEAAKCSAAKGHERASVDNLFSACELVSKAHLILHRSRATGSKKHRSMKNAINRWRKYGNVNEEFVRLFNRMSDERSSARYDVAARVQLPSQSDLRIVEREIGHLKRSVARRVDSERTPTT